MIKYWHFILFFISGCSISEHEGYKRLSEHIHYRILTLGNDNHITKSTDYVTLDLTYTNMQSEVLFEAVKTVQINNKTQLPELNQCLLLMHENQEATFILPMQWFYKDTNELARLKVHIYLHEVASQDFFLKEIERWEAWSENLERFEKVLVSHYISDSNFSMLPAQNKMIQKIIVEGTEKKILAGDTVILHYEGKFLDGVKFDSTWDRDQTFTYIVGQQFQLIRGLEKAVQKMSEGERSIFLLPSYDAFGKNGSSSGIIPPYTPVLYELQIIDVHPGPLSHISQ